MMQKLVCKEKFITQSPIQANFSKPSQNLLNKIPAQLLEMNFSQMEQKYKSLKETPPEQSQASIESLSSPPPPPTNSSSPQTQSQINIQTTKVPYTVSNPSFCEGFFITGISKDKAEVIENSENYFPICGHQLCKGLPAMQPDILHILT